MNKFARRALFAAILAVVGPGLARLPNSGRRRRPLWAWRSLAGRRDFTSAIAAYTEAIKLNPKSSVAYNGRGRAYGTAGESEKALKDFLQAIRLDPRFAEPFSGLGCVYIDMEAYDKAIASFNEAIRLDPKFAKAYYNRGECYGYMAQLRRGDRRPERGDPPPTRFHRCLL